MGLLSYSEFLFETYNRAYENDVRGNFLRAVSNKVLKNESDRLYVQHLIERGHTNKFFESILQNDFNIINESVENDFLFEETLIQKFKRKTLQAINTVKEKGKQALSAAGEALLKFGGSILKPLQWIAKQVANIVAKAWQKAKELAKKAVNEAKEKISSLVKKYIGDGEEMGEKGKNLLAELGNLDGMLGAAVKWATSGFASSLVKSGAEAANEPIEEGVKTFMYQFETTIIREATKMIESGYSIDTIIEEGRTIELYEQSILEGGGHGDDGGFKIPFITDLMNKIAHTPPFNLFHKIGDKAEEFTNNALGKASYLLSKVAEAPGPFKFEVIGGLVGVGISYWAETTAKGWTHDFTHYIEHMFHFTIPGLSMVFTIIKVIGISLAVYGIVKEVFSKQGKKEKLPDIEIEEPKEESDEEKK
jgi:hypothetical protein